MKGLNRHFGLYTPLDFLASGGPAGHHLAAHVPDEWEHLTRDYGWYSSVQRGSEAVTSTIIGFAWDSKKYADFEGIL